MRAMGCVLWGLADLAAMIVLLGLLLACVVLPCLTLASIGATREDMQNASAGAALMVIIPSFLLAAAVAIGARLFARRSLVQRAMRR